MRLVTFESKNAEPRPGVMTGEGIVDLCELNPSLPRGIREILAANALGRVAELASGPSAARAENIRLLSPIPQPSKVIGVGLNYRNHAIESGMAIPAEPIVFTKFATSVIGPEMPIRLPEISEEVDFEAELAVVIGRRGRNVAQGDAMNYVAGYTLANDVSARDWQLKKPGGQWILGKTFDTFCPLGPALVTSDEVPDPHNLRIQLRLNGETMQDSTTSELIFRVDQLIAYLSQIFTLEPGDVILTGTPPGVGFARKPPVFLRPGDVCEVEIEGLGILRNMCLRD
ncbi:MAG: fumarylacetoacetate hydrolase family protein [Pirellulales bacterium]